MRVLIVEDSEADAELIVRELRRGGYEPLHKRVETSADVMAALESQPWDLVIADYSLPQFNGLAALELLKKKEIDLPFLLVSANVSEAAAVAAMRAGAADYLRKDDLARLVPVIGRELTEAEARRQRRLATQQLQLKTMALEAAANGVAITDEKGVVIWVNAAFTAMTGYEPAEILGQNLRVLKSGAHNASFYKSLWDTILSGKVWRGEIINRRKNGSLYTEEQTITPVRSPDGGIPYFIAIKQDVTERKHMESALRESEEQFRRSRERMRALAARLQSVREEERTKVAREIHDELGQALTGLKMELAWLNRRTSPSGAGEVAAVVKEKFESMSRLLDQTINTVRRIATDLRPGVLDDLGLSAAIEWYVQEFQKRAGLGCDLRMEAGGMDYLGTDRSTAVFRIFQEILTNVARHAGATRVDVLITEEARHLVLEVRDNGKGITEEQVLAAQSLGLLGMQERAHVFGGSISFRGLPGEGTTVRVLIPLEKEEYGEDSGSR